MAFINSALKFVPGTPQFIFKQQCNVDVSIKIPSLPTVCAYFSKQYSKIFIYEGVNVPTGVTVVDNFENKFTVTGISPVIKEYPNKKGELVQCKLSELTVVSKTDDANSLLFLIKQESTNNSKIKIYAQGDIHIDGDIGSINSIQNLDLHTYWNYLKKDINDLFDSKSYTKDIQEIDNYFAGDKEIDTDKIRKSFKSIVLDSIRNFALDFLVKLTIELGKQK